MNYLDIIIIIFLFFAAISGFRKGLIHQLAILTALILGIFLAVKFSKLISPFIQTNFVPSENTSKIIAFVIIFISVLISIHLLGNFLEKLFDEVELGLFNKITGCIFGILKMSFIISVFMVMLKFSIVNFNWPNKKDTESSYLYRPIESFAPLLFPYLKLNKNSQHLNN